MTTDILRVVCRKASLFVERNAPTILTWMTGAGVVATAVSASKAGKEAQLKEMEVLIKKNPDLMEDDCEIEPLSLIEKLKIDAPYYIPTTIIGGVTIFCAFKSNSINQERQRSLAAAYIFLREKYDDYIQKVKEHFGEEAHEEIEHELLIERAEAPFISCQGFVKGSTTSVDLTDETRRLFFDAYSGKLFESTMAKVLEAEYHLNRSMALGAFVTMKDWYDFLGVKCFDDCPPWKVNPECLDAVGWEVNDSYQWIDFDHDVAKMEFPNGSGMTELEAVVIHFEFDPMPESYYDY